MTNTKIMYRQGDLLFIKIDNLPTDLQKLNTRDILKSSVTGHSHRIIKGIVFANNNISRAGDRMGNFYLDLSEDDELVHEEHKTIPLPKGIYEVRRQAEVNGYVQD